MENDTAQTKASQNYASAHAEHYKNKALGKALDLYQGVMADHPDSPEAEYSRSQIQNIAKSVVSKQELLDAEIKMARAHIDL